ncbi:MAG: VWA domain-containing protein [Burkholderiaceae bacterium]|nr:VWA domain-containing protein [Burkholderiaceae bacterium]
MDWRHLLSDWRTDRRRGVLLLAALALAATFLQPTVNLPRRLFEHVVVIDVTQSMNVTDQRIGGAAVSRLAAAKHALRAALDELPCGSKLGWAVFTEHRSYLLLTPLEVCANRAELRATLAHIDGRMAWSGGSEVAKALHGGIVIAKELAGRPSLVFVTDGHEAPPLNARLRPSFDDKPGEVAGLIVGVGERNPSPIPKFDPSGRPLGWWSADEVMQTDLHSQGRGGSVLGERLIDDAAPTAIAPNLGATPGREHLSGLREDYLRLLAQENGLAYLRLREPRELAAALRARALARPVVAPVDGRIALAALALALLLGLQLAPWWAAWTRGRR